MKKHLKLFDLDDEAESAAYLEIWRSGLSRRPHDHPHYLRMMRRDNQHPQAVVYYEDDRAAIIYPYYEMHVGDAFPPEEGRASKHIVSAYGYGGPVLLGGEVDHDAFEHLLISHFRDRRVISEFVREDLFGNFKVRRRFPGDKQQDNIVINLEKSPEQLWNSYKYSVRKNIKRATSSDLEIVFDFEGRFAQDFVDLYHSTMRRKDANPVFLISYEEFLKFNVALLEDSLGFYVHVLSGREVVATELVLRSPTHLYSFLGGANIDHSDKRPSDFLKNEVSLWGMRHGILGYVLGGGVTPYDGIYNFKLAFDQKGVVPFTIQRNIHDADAYEEMVRLKRLAAEKAGKSWAPSENFFPAFFS